MARVFVRSGRLTVGVLTLNLIACGSAYGATEGAVLAGDTTPDWSLLNVSALAAIIAAAVVVGIAFFMTVRRGERWPSWVQPGADWDFADSWASNVTIGASALAAVFGSSNVVTAVGGDDATVAPLIVVGSALALAVVTAAPLVVKTFSSNGKVSAAAIAAAAVLTLAAAGFEGLVIVRLASTLQLGGIESWIWLAGVFLAALLSAYAIRTLHAIFTMPAEQEGIASATRRRAAVL